MQTSKLRAELVNVADCTLCCVCLCNGSLYPSILTCLKYFTFHCHQRQSIRKYLYHLSVYCAWKCIVRVFHSLCFRVLAFTVGGTILFYIFLTSYKLSSNVQTTKRHKHKRLNTNFKFNWNGIEIDIIIVTVCLFWR